MFFLFERILKSHKVGQTCTGFLRRAAAWLLIFGIGAGKAFVVHAEGEPDILTPHAVLMEVSTGQVLYEKNAQDRIHPASVTKVMTMLLIFEALQEGRIALTDEVTTSAYARSMGGSQVFLEEGEKQTVETLLKCIVIASGNDAAVTMAEHLAGTEQAFVEQMNQEAKRLGMENTNFVDCCGLTDSVNHYTSAMDVALMSRELLCRFPQVTEYSRIWMEDITHVTARGSSRFTLTNTNKLLRSFDGCDGLKTGSTSLAGCCLSATAARNGIRLISVVMTAPDTKTRFADAGALLNYGFSRCSLYEDEDMGKPSPVRVRGAAEDYTELVYESGFCYLSTSGEDFSKIEKTLELPEEIKAPLAAGEQVGSLVYMLDGKEIGRIAVLTEREVEKEGYFNCLGRVIGQWMI